MFNFTQDQKCQFLQAAFVALKKNGFIPAYETDVFTELTRTNFHAWGGDVKLAQCIEAGGGEVGAAIRDFLGWVGARRDAEKSAALSVIAKKHIIAIDRVGVELEIPLGEKGRLTFKAEGQIDPESDITEFEDFYADLFNHAWHGYLSFANHGEKFNMGGVEKSYTAQSGDTAQSFDATSIIVETKGGKRDFKVKGDKFPIHGVRIFPEVIASAGIDPASITTEKYITGVALYVNKANGEPHKVVSLTLGKAGL